MLFLSMIRSLLLQTKNVPYGLYTQARKLENDGQLEAALVSYETALDAAKKARFHEDLRFKIIEKLKILHMMVDYQNNNKARNV